MVSPHSSNLYMVGLDQYDRTDTDTVSDFNFKPTLIYFDDILAKLTNVLEI